MTNFNIISDLPVLDLYSQLNQLLKDEIISWDADLQICLNCTQEGSYNYKEGTGSLRLDWSNQYTVLDENGNEKIVVPERDTPKSEIDFKHLCEVFKDTLFESVYNALRKKYTIGRVRLMKSRPKSCLSWHIDYYKRIHFPIKTQEGCFMVIEDEVCFLEESKWWDTNTTVYHTAVNASKEDRIHLVVTIIEEC